MIYHIAEHHNNHNSQMGFMRRAYVTVNFPELKRGKDGTNAA
jgi:hypothetical protein